MKAAIIYASVHHENTKKVVEAIAGENAVDLIDATKEKERDLSGYDLIGFASGVYYGKFHQTVLNFASVNLPADKDASDLHLWRQCGIPVNRRSCKKQAGEDRREIFL